MENENKNTEPVVQEGEVKTEDGKGLDRRAALEAALEAAKDESERRQAARDDSTPREAPKAKGEGAERPTRDSGGRNSNTANNNRNAERPLEPPAEWNKEEKEDFKGLSPTQQKAALRVYASRKGDLEQLKAKHEEIKRDMAEREWLRELEREINPVLKAQGETRSLRELMLASIKLRNEWEKGDPRAVSAAFLKARGITPPKELLESSAVQKAVEDERISALQSELNTLKMKQAEIETGTRLNSLIEAFHGWSHTANAAGGTRYPDINDGESGLRIQRAIGTLVSGESEQSKQFIALAKAQNPGITLNQLMEKAYIFSGGRIDDSAPRSQESQKNHLAISNRAAASVPGRASHSATNGAVKKFKTRREALEHFFREQQRD